MNASEQPVHHSLRRLLPPLWVWGVWLAMLVAALAFVDHYGSNVPSWDGWDMVPTLTGHQPVTAEWLWSQHNEHRVPLPRLVLLGLHRITGINFRTPMFFNVLVMGALSLAMILVATRLRGGRTSYTDAFFPLILLHWGQAANLIWGWQLQFYASMALSCIALLLIVRDGPQLRPRLPILLGICLVLLPLCGANGLVLVPPLALWLGYRAVLVRRTDQPEARRDRLVILSLAACALLLSALYLVGWDRVPHQPFRFSVWSITTAAKVIAMGFGPGLVGLDVRLLPVAFWPIPCLAVLCFLGGSVALLLKVAWSTPHERPRVLGLLAFMAAMGSLGLSLGLGRNAFETRYVTLTLPTWCAVYFIWSLHAPPRWNASATGLLLALSLATLWPNIRFGVEHGTDVRTRLASFENDMLAGVPSYQLAFRHWRYLHPHQDILDEYMPMLREAGVGSFGALRENPAFRKVSVPLVPQSLYGMRWDAGTASATGRGDTSSVVFSLPKAEYAYGIRLRYTYWNDDLTLPLLLFYWRRDGHEEFAAHRSGHYSATGDRANWERGTWGRAKEPESTLTVWVCDDVKDIRIHPDVRPGVLRVSELVLLAPPADVDCDPEGEASHRRPPC